jgi:hypothetical protein
VSEKPTGRINLKYKVLVYTPEWVGGVWIGGWIVMEFEEYYSIMEQYDDGSEVDPEW